MAKVRPRKWMGADGKERKGFVVDFTDSNGKRQIKQFKRKDEAQAYRVEIEGQLRAGTFRPHADKITLKEVAEKYLKNVRGRSERGEKFSKRHLAMVEGRIWNYVCPDPKRAETHKGVRRATPFNQGLGGVKLAHLTPPVVDAFRDRLRNANVSVPLTRKIISTLHAILEFAVRNNFVAVNAARGCEVIGKREDDSKKVKAPSKEALQQIIGVADPDFRVQLLFAAASGLRAGEQHALRWKHVDFEKRSVTVETRVDAYNEEDLPKSDAGLRTVPLGEAVLTQLRLWKLRSKWSQSNDLVFPNKRGGYVRHGHMLQYKFYPLFVRLAKMHEENPTEFAPPPARFNWHSLRHFAVSCWIEAGMPPKRIQTYAGHATLAMTTDTYGHLFPDEDHSKAFDEIAKGLLTTTNDPRTN